MVAGIRPREVADGLGAQAHRWQADELDGRGGDGDAGRLHAVQDLPADGVLDLTYLPRRGQEAHGELDPVVGQPQVRARLGIGVADEVALPQRVQLLAAQPAVLFRVPPGRIQQHLLGLAPVGVVGHRYRDLLPEEREVAGVVEHRLIEDHRIAHHAPATGSAILAGVLLKMGTYGFVRIAMPMLPGAWRRHALVFLLVGVVSVLYGALVALAQTSFKRMVAYTSVNHMGYVLLAVGAAGVLAGTDAQARQLAVTDAVTQMVSHGLLTGALFLLTGVFYDRGRSYRMDSYSGLAARAPVFAGVTAVAAFGSLGLPGLSGFVAEFQILTGSLGSAATATAVAFLGILLTAALFLWAL